MRRSAYAVLIGLLLGSAVAGDPLHVSQPAGAREAYAAALELYRGGEYARAGELLQEAIDRGAAGAAHLALLGWCRLNLSDPYAAGAAFSRAAELEPGSVEARTGLGYVALRLGDVAAAREAFERAVELAPGSGDAWKGLGLARLRAGEAQAALGAFGKAMARSREDPEVPRLLRQARRAVIISEESRPRPAAAGDAPLRIDVRAVAGRFELRSGKTWEPFFVKGVNLGTALPGRWSVEFPDDHDLYRQWFAQMGQLGINTVRLYTLHPPSLYRALHEHNAEHPGQRLLLVQGVWAELPPGHDYDDPAFVAEMQHEIRRVIDAVHGNLVMPPRRGHAHGIYDVDVSEDLLAYVLGREWEPFSVDDYQKLRPERDAFRGEYVRAEQVQPMEAWLASILETAAAHETEYYRQQHPLAFASWPTLDPLHHPTESNAEEEWVMRGDDPSMYDPDRPIYDEDRVQADPKKITATEAFEAGLFAAYHVYPYYPDFLFLDPDYLEANDGEGVSPYLGYLQELARHHGEQPLLVAEFGVPSSRGISHLHPVGQDHGGHTTTEQGEINVRLLRNIHQAGLAGGIVFSWIDEWWKSNWAVRNREVPHDRSRLWLNVMDPEQNFGLLAAWPGERGWKITLDGEPGDWAGIEPLYRSASGALRELRVTTDEAFLYIFLSVAELDWAEDAYWIGIDTHDADRGDHRLPEPCSAEIPVGLEFLIRFDGPQRGRLLVDTPYRVSEGRAMRACRSEVNSDGQFADIISEPNRERYGRDGTRFAARTYSRSPLRHGTTNEASPDYDSLADWYAGVELIEARIPWGLLNVADPSSHQVIEEQPHPEAHVTTRTTDGFRFHVVALRQSEGKPLRAVDSFPDREQPVVADYPLYIWPGWNQPRYHLVTKRAYYILQRELPTLP